MHHFHTQISFVNRELINSTIYSKYRLVKHYGSTDSERLGNQVKKTGAGKMVA